MAINPATLKVVAKIVTSAASDERVRRVILIACLIPFLIILLVLSSPFAIFFAIIGGDKNADSVSVYEMMYTLNDSFKESIVAEESDITMDEIHTIAMGSESNTIIDNTTDVLITFAVKYNMLDENAEQMAVLNKKQIKKLKKIYHEMNTITSSIETITEEYEYTSTDEDNNTTTETIVVNKNIKSIYVNSLTVDEMMTKYKFNEKQIVMVKEMQKSEFGMLFSRNVTTS